MYPKRTRVDMFPDKTKFGNLNIAWELLENLKTWI